MTHHLLADVGIVRLQQRADVGGEEGELGKEGDLGGAGPDDEGGATGVVDLEEGRGRGRFGPGPTVTKCQPYIPFPGSRTLQPATTTFKLVAPETAQIGVQTRFG